MKLAVCQNTRRLRRMETLVSVFFMALAHSSLALLSCARRTRHPFREVKTHPGFRIILQAEKWENV
ncbi:hypothetical protein ANANG_G00116630 [Anguilla anguilla]|uniref:Uncharacterized protein n=1 Tax=Anguilla anguilla TaxID=7936 RepID=A0A9D3MID3_ANGAN|nr:hypothetical protein ANANG_G00116630 [Anguilla anguilla]